MGNLKLTSTNPRMAGNVTALPLGGDVKMRVRRQGMAPANANPHLPRADQLALANIAQRFAPGSQAPAAEEQRSENRPQPPQVQGAQGAPVVTSPVAASLAAVAPRGLRTLIGALIAVALLPSALFAVMMLLGAIQVSWPSSWLKAQESTWPAAAPASVTGRLAADKPQAQPEPRPDDETVTATIAPQVPPDPEPAPEVTAAVPPQVEASRLPTGAPEPKPVKTVSVGAAPEDKPVSAGMPTAQPSPAPAKEPEATASIAPATDDAKPDELPYDTNLIGVVSWDVKKHELLGATGVEEVFTTPDDAEPPPEHLMRAPETDDEGKTWVTAPQFVNLRKGPTSSAAVISVVAKGAKLEVLGRKRGWVKVNSPESSESGWIYMGSKARRSKKGDETADGGSFWGSLFGSESD